MSAPIPVDFDYVSTTHVASYTYTVSRLVPFTCAEIIIVLYSDIDRGFGKAIVMTIEGEEYSLWGNDDSYIADLVAKKVASLHQPQ
jgi:hypothetical protein